MTPWRHLVDNPPGAVRLMARRKLQTKTIRAISDEEIAIASGIPLARVQAIYHLKNWDGVPVGELRGFCKACGFDPFSGADRNRRNTYVRTAQWTYLKKSPWWATIFEPLILRMKGAAA
jgi:hypothetical protein